MFSSFNVVYRRSNSLLFAASKSPSALVRAVFRDSASVCYSCSGYNNLFGTSDLKIYDPHSQLCANVIRSVRCSPFSDNSFEDNFVRLVNIVLYHFN